MAGVPAVRITARDNFKVLTKPEPESVENTENTFIIDYSCKKKVPKSDYDHNIVTIISDTRSKQLEQQKLQKNRHQHQRQHKKHQNQKPSWNNISVFSNSYSSKPRNAHETWQTRNNILYSSSTSSSASSAFRTFVRNDLTNETAEYATDLSSSRKLCDDYDNNNCRSKVNNDTGGTGIPTVIASAFACINPAATVRVLDTELDEIVPEEELHINSLYPEILTLIFSYLNTADKGHAAQVCKYWQQVSYEKVIWKNIQAKIHLKSKGNSIVYSSLTRRGIHQIQILSLKKSLRELFIGLPILTSLNLSGCYNVTDLTLFNSSNELLKLQQGNNNTGQGPSNYYGGHSSSSSSRTRFFSPAANNVNFESSSSYPILQHLTQLDLSLCKQISDISLARIALRAQNLQVLELGGCCQITDRGLLIISYGFKKLNRLNLRSCHLISDVGIGFLAGRVHREHLNEPKALEFLCKFGLIESNSFRTDILNPNENSSSIGICNNNSLIDLNNRVKSMKNKSVQSPAAFEYDYEPPKSKRSKVNNNTSLSLSRSSHDPQQQQQQCSLCHQFIPNQTAAAFQYESGGINSSSNCRKRKWVNDNQSSSSNSSSLRRMQQPSATASDETKFQTKAAILPKIGPKTIFGTTQLQTLILQDCQKLTDTCLTYISPSGSDLTESDYNASSTSSVSTSSTIIGLLELQSINLSFCVHISDSGLKQLGKLPKLQELNLRSCDSITDTGLSNLKEVGPHLLILDISFCDKINNIGLNYIAQWMNNLKSLSISSCNISDNGLQRIAGNLYQSLEILHLGQCGNITDDGIKVIAEKCTRIKEIDLYGCNKISKVGLDVIKGLKQQVKLNLRL